MTRVNSIYSLTRVNMGTQDIEGYKGDTVSLGRTWVHRIYRGIQGIQYY